jgi:C-terminal processing protease CtpA/Prc
MKRHSLTTMKWLPAAVAIIALAFTSQTTFAQDDRYDDDNYERQSSSRDRDSQSNAQDRSQYDRREDQSNQRSSNQQSSNQRSRQDQQSRTYRDDSERNERWSNNENDENRPAGLGVMLDASQGDVEVRDVAPNSPADRAGIERGDQILAVNGREIEGVQQLTRMIRDEDPGSRIEIRIRRDGEQRTVNARLESLRQALDSMDRGRQESGQYQESFYGNSPPWDDNEIMRHVDIMERQVERMKQEIEDLRTMLSDDPSQRRFSTSQRERRNDSRMRD